MIQPVVIQIASKFQKDEMFQGVTVGVGTLFDPGYSLERVGDTDVEKVELRGGYRFALSSLLIGRELVSDQCVLENLIVFPHGSRRESSVGGYRTKIDLLTTGKSGDLKKARKILNGARQSFSANLFL